MKDNHHDTNPIANSSGLAPVSRRTAFKTGLAGLGLFGLAPMTSALAAENRGPNIQLASRQDAYVPTPSAARHILRIQETEMNPDGRKTMRGITANGEFPGPEIRIKEGEMFRAQVENHLPDEDTSIHWHGLLLPAVMDGVPGVAHEAIKPKQVQIFEYPILQSGTYWYHSHSGVQEQVGLGGPFIIEPEHEPLSYDREYVVFLSDWLHRSPEEVFAKLREGEEGGMDMDMGKPDLADIAYESFLINGKGNDRPWTCLAKPGDRVRFRIIGAGASTFFRFMVDGHQLTVTHCDGLAVQPVVVGNLLVGMGETYDVLVTVKGTGSFTIRAVAQDESGQAVGVLHTPDARPKADLSKPVWGPKALAYSDLRSAEPSSLPAGPVREINMELTGDMAKYRWGIDGQFYPDGARYYIREGERIRVTMKNKTMMWHPMHLHGHFFRVILPGSDPSLWPLKHTVNIAPKETLSFEFYADNLGRWIFHCHNLYHLDAGMGRVFIYEV